MKPFTFLPEFLIILHAYIPSASCASKCNSPYHQHFCTAVCLVEHLLLHQLSFNRCRHDIYRYYEARQGYGNGWPNPKVSLCHPQTAWFEIGTSTPKFCSKILIIISTKANVKNSSGGLELSRLSTGNIQWPRSSHALFPFPTADGRYNRSKGSKDQENCEEASQRRSQSSYARWHSSIITASGKFHETRASPVKPLHEMGSSHAQDAHSIRYSARLVISKWQLRRFAAWDVLPPQLPAVLHGTSYAVFYASRISFPDATKHDTVSSNSNDINWSQHAWAWNASSAELWPNHLIWTSTTFQCGLGSSESGEQRWRWFRPCDYQGWEVIKSETVVWSLSSGWKFDG